jgi:bacterioferritin
MKGHQRVVAHLQRLLTLQLAAAEQYMLHAHVCEDWGFARLAAHQQEAAADARTHVDLLVRRMLFLGATPDPTQRETPQLGTSVRDMFRLDLDSRYQFIEGLRTAMGCCVDERDFETQRLLGEVLRSHEEVYAYWLEQQLGLIEAVGIENYLAAQL